MDDRQRRGAGHDTGALPAPAPPGPNAAAGRPWRSLAEWADPAAHARAPGEFPVGADDAQGLSRRHFLQLVGASMALASGCARDLPEKILPYSVQPREVRPGIPAFYATSMVIDGYATGLLVESHEGRPTKIEGNPEHPASLGATGALHQASVLGLYDPHRGQRVRGPTGLTGAAGWPAIFDRLRAPRRDGGAGLRVVLEPTGSPLVLAQIEAVRKRFPVARFVFHAPFDGRHALEGARLVFGRPLLPQHDLLQADVILALDADFLGGASPFGVRYQRQFAERRRPSGAGAATTMSRLYAVECMLSQTGAMADHRLRRRSAEVGRVALAVAAELPGMPDEVRAVGGRLPPEERRWARAVAGDLLRHRGSGLVLVGERQPPELHALAHAMNAALDNAGHATSAIEPVLGEPAGATQDLAALVEEIRAHRVDTVLVIDANPVYTAPGPFDLRRHLGEVPDSYAFALHENETAAACRWFAPTLHYLESWGDARAYDGTLSLIQPLVRPLYDGHTAAEILAALAGDRFPDGYRLLRDRFEQAGTGAGAAGTGQSDGFAGALRRGFVPGSAAKPVAAAISHAGVVAAAGRLIERSATPAGGGAPLELNFYPSPTVHDGRFANNAWLMEQPEAVTKLTWGNAALLGPRTAERLGLKDEDLVDLSFSGRTARAPVLVVPGHADEAVSVWLGFGRAGGEEIAAGRGVDFYPLRTADDLAFSRGLELRRAPGQHALARTQLTGDMHDRPIALVTTLAGYRKSPSFTETLKGPVPSLMPDWPRAGLQWAMTIDLGRCTGCGACMLACRAENNLLVVGEEQVKKGREMDWLRIDTYFEGDPADPGVVHQPMMCQHCEYAPCEYVCPVNATVHSPDGLNEMVYNRCVGTRFCSNNCPYKVRRFNWFDWSERQPINQGPVTMQRNPDVTVRERGVMEKCTYCVQRIRRAEIQAELEGREIRPGEFTTACAQACPTRAIQFGSLSHGGTEMLLWREEPRSYAVLHDQGTRPRTMYLARVRNPNPEIG